MSSIVRDSLFGQLAHTLSKGRLFPHPEDRPDFVVPPYLLRPSGAQTLRLSIPPEPHYQPATHSNEKQAKFTLSAPPSRSSTENLRNTGSNADITPMNSSDGSATATGADVDRKPSDATLVDQASAGASSPAKKHNLAPLNDTHHNRLTEMDQPETRYGDVEDTPGLVDWYGPDDPANPQNWSRGKKAWTVICIFLLTFTIYAGSAIYTPSIPGIMEEFNSSLVVATLGLSLYVAAYGLGPMIWSPLQELPGLGRNSVYIVTLFLYLCFNVGAALSPNIASLLVFRALSGFAGSPALATGAATIADVYSKKMIPYLIGLWAMGAVCGPVFAPVIASYAVEAKGWRWSMWELVWISGFSTPFLFFFFPETYSANILKRRASRLRRVTGKPSNEVSSQGERDQASLSTSELVSTALGRPFRLLIEPAVGFLSVYLGFVYALFYLWFESFPLVFNDIYHFSAGAQGLPFLGFAVAAIITYIGYAAYLRYYLEPREARGMEPEARLELALMASWSIPIAMLLFGWLARPNLSYWGPIVAAAIYFPGIYLNFQSILVYLSISYGENAASVNAANTLARSVIASVFPLFGRDLFVNLGLGPGSSLLAGIAIIMLIPLFFIMRYGKRLRAMSRFTQPVDKVSPKSEIEKNGAPETRV